MHTATTEPADRDLLRAFAERRDEAAFAELVRRHGPLVLSVCRRVLNDTPEADDAFQAVFLVLARKPGSVRRPERVASWLYGVAVRCARRARSATAARRAKEHPMSDVAAPAAADPIWADARPVLDEEIGRLPEKLRAAVVLCELEGLGRAEAAARLGVPEGTLSSRLARAKEALRLRLKRRGLSLTVVGVGVILSQARTAAAVPPALFEAVAGLAVSSAGGAGAVSAAAAGLARQELGMMFVKNLVLGVALGVGVVGAVGGGWFGVTALRAAAADKATKADTEKLQGEWKIVSAMLHGKKIDGAEAERILGKGVVFKGDKVTFHVEATFTLDASKKPKQIDLVPHDGPESEKGKTFRGVYELDGDKLTLHANGPDGERPTGLESKDDEPRAIWMRLERVKR